MLDFDFMHVVESALGLTVGSLLARAIGRACERTCSNPEVQQMTEILMMRITIMMCRIPLPGNRPSPPMQVFPPSRIL